jgi:Spy/CpxP family protein refolding chaperone
MNKLISLSVMTIIFAFSPFVCSQGTVDPSCTNEYQAKLLLSPEQQMQFQALQALGLSESKEFLSQQIAMHDRVNALVQSESLDESKLAVLINEKKELAGNALRKEIELKHSFYHILTEDQRVIFMQMLNTCGG